MLRLQADLIHKSIDLRPPVCQIEKIIELPHDEFGSLAYNPYVDRRFISENRDCMGKWNGINHCLLVLDKSGNDGILINAEGYDNVRYGAYVSHARDYVEREMERTAELYLKIPPDPETGKINIYLEDIEEYTGAEIRKDSVIAGMLYDELQKSSDVAEVTVVGDALVVTPAPVQTQGAAGSLKLRDVLLLGNFENVYMVHEASDESCVLADDFATLTDKGREDHAELLNASVVKIRHGEQGIEVALSGVEPRALADFAQAAADHARAESMMGPVM